MCVNVGTAGFAQMRRRAGKGGLPMTWGVEKSYLDIELPAQMTPRSAGRLIRAPRREARWTIPGEGPLLPG